MTKRIALLVTGLVLACTCLADPPEKYIPGTKRKCARYATPEPGTYIKPAAYRIVKKVNRLMEKPKAFREPPGWLMHAAATKQKRICDTALSYTDGHLPLRIYYPSGECLSGQHPVILFMHGGGFVTGSVELYHLMVSRLARTCNCIVVSVDYRLAPDHPYPAALEDAYLALSWLQDHGSRIGADSGRIIVMGDSAGGNLATVLSLLCRDRGRPQPASQVLIYPAVSFRETRYPSRVHFAMHEEKNYILSESFLRKVKADYMGKESDESLPYLSPLLASIPEDMPPAMIITAECDPLRDGGRAYATKLIDAGIPVHFMEYSGMIHGFLSFHPLLGDASHAMKQIADYVSRF